MSALPPAARIFAAMDVTWPAAEVFCAGSWSFRRGLGGGKRVSAATTDSAQSDDQISLAEAEMSRIGQNPLFMIKPENAALDRQLAARKYRIVDPVLVFCGRVEAIAAINPAPLDAIPCEAPLALMVGMWKTAGIDAARLDVMRRTKVTKTHLFSRHKETPAGVAFVACDGEIAMLHALDVTHDCRRFGVARKMLGRAAIWAREQGASYLSTVTTGQNLPAQRLFTGVGMQVTTKYHYRMK